MEHACIIVASSQASLSITTLQQRPIIKSLYKHRFLKYYAKNTANRRKAQQNSYFENEYEKQYGTPTPDLMREEYIA